MKYYDLQIVNTTDVRKRMYHEMKVSVKKS